MSRNIFNSVKLYKPNRNGFDLSHDKKLSLDIGGLYPVMLLDCVPGDKFSISHECLLKTAPMVAPPMHRFDVYLHTFFVPKRLCWQYWENYITRTPNQISDLLPEFPFIEFSDTNPVLNRGLSDYLGLPQSLLVAGVPTGNTPTRVSALPFAVYYYIWKHYFRDENLQPVNPAFDDDVTPVLFDGTNTASTELYLLRSRAWTKDYFTSALPWAQKGEVVQIPTGVTAVRINNVSGSILDGSIDASVIAGTTTGVAADALFTDGYADDESSPTINDLTFAQRLQEWFEKMARGGSRYIEQIKEHFGVFSSDKRLQRPEYIGGMRSPIIISEVLNTTGTDDLPQGNMSGRGVSANYAGGSSYFCEEHGYIMTVMSVLPRPAYQQGIPKHFLKINDAYENFFPSFAHLGEQEIFQKEIFAWTANGEDTFGYTPRYAEYRFENSTVHGDFRDSLDFWHDGRIFATEPTLSAEFIECKPEDSERLFAVQDPTVNKLYAHVLNKVFASRLMPKFGTPIH